MNRPRSAFTALLAGLIACLATGIEARAVGIWHRDYASARNEAKLEGKKLLIVFTGTDWIEICTKFYDEILGEPAFIDAVSEKFALLKLEFPKDNRLPREEAVQKALLREAYRVRGFPTVVLTDAEGRPFGVNGYQPLKPQEYAGQILAIAATHEQALAALREAESLAGLEKAEKLRAGIPDLPGALAVRFYRPEMEAILAADPEDSLKLAGPFGKLFAEMDYGREMQNLAREAKWEEAIAATDRHISEQKLEGGSLQTALLGRAAVERRAGQGEKSAATLREIIKIDPESEPGREAARLLERGQSEQDGEGTASGDP